MIASNMETFVVNEYTETLDPLGQVSFIYKPIQEIECAIFLKEQRNVDGDIRFIDATHTGITRDKNLRKGQKLTNAAQSFEIILVPQTLGRFTTLVLKEV